MTPDKILESLLTEFRGLSFGGQRTFLEHFDQIGEYGLKMHLEEATRTFRKHWASWKGTFLEQAKPEEVKFREFL